jgi:hypothetical protein
MVWGWFKSSKDPRNIENIDPMAIFKSKVDNF